MTSWNGLCKLPTLIFGKTQKPSWIKGSILMRWQNAKEKTSEHICQC